MTHYPLIDGYVHSFRAKVHWRSDADDLAAEVADHLYSAVERSGASDDDTEQAQERALERLGDHHLLARGFAATPGGGLAVPTEFTRNAGLAGLGSALLMLTFAISGTAAVLIDARSIGGGRGWEQLPMLVAWLALIGAFASIPVLMIGLKQRHGGLGALGSAGIALATLGALLTPAVWLFIIWGPLLGMGLLIFAVAMLRHDLAPRAGSVAFGAGMVFGVVLLFALWPFQLGPRSATYGDYPLAILVGFWGLVAITSVGLVRLGGWLHGEEPADLGHPDRAVTA
jgi:hypothetical protein